MQAAHRRGGSSGLYPRSDRRPSREENGHRRHGRDENGQRHAHEQQDWHARENGKSMRSRRHSWHPDADGPATIQVSISFVISICHMAQLP